MYKYLKVQKLQDYMENLAENHLKSIHKSTGSMHIRSPLKRPLKTKPSSLLNSLIIK